MIEQLSQRTARLEGGSRGAPWVAANAMTAADHRALIARLQASLDKIAAGSPRRGIVA